MDGITQEQAFESVKKTFEYLSNEFHGIVDFDKKWVHTDNSNYIIQANAITVPLDNGVFTVVVRTSYNNKVNNIAFRYMLPTTCYRKIITTSKIERAVPYNTTAKNLDAACMKTAKALITACINKGKEYPLTTDGKIWFTERPEYIHHCVPDGINELRGTLFAVKRHLKGAYADEQAEISRLLEATANAIKRLSIKHDTDAANANKRELFGQL